ncbi:hypothetical protein Vretifemale_13290 [Volvox reticuliferus]|uniref:HNH domain-containing protein n=2 Tax=Volvox reticuliferus TaxID=1737510 RepID=A0A8J4FS00_9CHLO|nr:hypothetical protein Vretifemale_13290 [Volvox reticuliferus]
MAVAASCTPSAAILVTPEDEGRGGCTAGGGARASMRLAAALGAGGGSGGGCAAINFSDPDEKADGSVARLSFVGPVGLVAPQPSLTPSQLVEGVAEAAAFVRDWCELRAVSRNRLYGAVLERYFQDALEAITNEAIAAGAYGTSTSRYVQGVPVKVPEGATLQPVQVRTEARYGNGNGGGTAPATDTGSGAPAGWRTFQQVFLADGHRLCLNCAKPVQDCSLPASMPLDTSDYLFCEPHCETGYFVKGSGSTLCRTLARLEHGVCQMCGLDCTNLVRQLQTIRTTSRDYLAKRRAVVEHLAPRLTCHGYTALLERLLRTATEGFAWPADHITPVYAGGGLCDVDNMRTLCVACHADVTKAQCKQRAAERQQRRYGTKDIRTFWAASGKAGGLPPVPPSKRRPDPEVGLVNKRRRPAASRLAYIDTSDDSPARTAMLAVAAVAAPPPGGKRAMKGPARGGGNSGGCGGKVVRGSTKDAPFVPMYDDDDNIWEFHVVDLAGSDDEGMATAKVQVADGTADVLDALLTEVVDLADSDEGGDNGGDGDEALAAAAVCTAAVTDRVDGTQNSSVHPHLLPTLPPLPLASPPSPPSPPSEREAAGHTTLLPMHHSLPTYAAVPRTVPLFEEIVTAAEEADGGNGGGGGGGRGHSVLEAVSETKAGGRSIGYWAGWLRARVQEGRGTDGSGISGGGGISAIGAAAARSTAASDLRCLSVARADSSLAVAMVPAAAAMVATTAAVTATVTAAKAEGGEGEGEGEGEGDARKSRSRGGEPKFWAAPEAGTSKRGLGDRINTIDDGRSAVTSNGGGGKPSDGSEPPDGSEAPDGSCQLHGPDYRAVVWVGAVRGEACDGGKGQRQPAAATATATATATTASAAAPRAPDDLVEQPLTGAISVAVAAAVQQQGQEQLQPRRSRLALKRRA